MFETSPNIFFFSSLLFALLSTVSGAPISRVVVVGTPGDPCTFADLGADEQLYINSVITVGFNKGAFLRYFASFFFSPFFFLPRLTLHV